MPEFTSPPPKPPMKAKSLDTSGRERSCCSITRSLLSVTSRLVPTGVWNRIWKLLVSWVGTNSCRSRGTMASERMKKSAAAATTRARWRRAGPSQRR
jgi:hypothetical protein